MTTRTHWRPELLRQEIKMENRKWLVQLLVGIAAAVAIGRFWLFHT